MTKQESIKYISSLINAPATITEGDQSSIAVFRQRFPYFVPMRYLLALESHKKSPWSPAMLSSVQPYMGNWMLFCNFLETGSGAVAAVTDEMPAAEKEPETVAELPIEEDAETEILVDDAEQPFIQGVTEEIKLTENAPVEEAVFTEAEGDVKEDIADEAITAESELDPLITPIHSQDYFLHQGERVSEDIPAEISELKYEPAGEEEEDKSLMVMMSFSEWLLHFKNVSEKQKEEVKDRKALRTMWQKEKLAAAMEEENEEIPENVFEMAVNSISNEDGLASETLAEIYTKQGKYDKAIEMYRKLSLRNPQKNVYFARKIDEVLKDKQS